MTQNGVFFVFTCQNCSREHQIKLDSAGHFDGKLPCGKKIGLQVDPQEWRRTIALYQEHVTIH